MSDVAKDNRPPLRAMSTIGRYTREPTAGDVARISQSIGKPGDWTFTDKSGLTLSAFQGVPLPPAETGVRKISLRLKATLDFFIALMALFFLTPLILITAAAVKITSPGPVFFTQMREGIHGTLFPIFKFRTMRSDLCDSAGIAFTKANDSRVTAIGRFLRATSIDELPQLLNVLRGEMAIVGPRPHVPNMLVGDVRYAECVPYYGQRLQMLPGITGWAQINRCRGLVDTPAAAFDRVDHDIAYVQNYSLLLDFRIIFLTALREFLVGGAS